MAIKIKGAGRTEKIVEDTNNTNNIVTPDSNIIIPTNVNKIHLQRVSFCEDKEEYKEGDERFVMIQFLGMSQQGPIVMSRVYKGTNDIDPEEIQKKLEGMKSKLIITNSNNEIMQDLDNMNDILTEEYEYSTVPLYCILNFS